MISALRGPRRTQHIGRLRDGGKVVYLGTYRNASDKLRAVDSAKQRRSEGLPMEAVSIRVETEERDEELWFAAFMFPDRKWTPAERLRLKLLEVTYLDLRSLKKRRRTLARAWVESDDRSHPMSFASVCDVLGRNPEEVRSRMLDVATQSTRDRR